MRLGLKRTSIILACLVLLITVGNIFVLVYHQHAESLVHNGNRTVAVVIQEKAPSSYSFLKALQMEIKETFRRYEANEETVGKAYQQAAIHQKKGRYRRNFTVFPDCEPTPFLLVEVHTKPKNFMEREAIRLTWGRPQNVINAANAGEELNPSLWKTVFLIGHTQNERLDKLLEVEANHHKDMIFGNFIDSYRNLSRKMAFGVEWASKHCQARYVLKTDDDSFVNILKVIKLLKKYQRIYSRGSPLYFGAALLAKEPYRDKENKFYVSRKEYPEPTYPPYAAGGGYVFSGNLLKNLSIALKVVKLFPNEDACFGALMQYIGVSLLNNDRFIPFSTRVAVYRKEGGYSLCKFNSPLVIHRISGKLQIQTHFNVLVLQHVPTICHHIKHGIGEDDNFVDFENDYENILG